MTKKSFMILPQKFLALFFCLASCDSKNHKTETDKSTELNTRSRGSKRDTPENLKANSSKPKNFSETESPPQSTDESILEWASDMIETRPELVEKALLEMSKESTYRQDLIRLFSQSLLAKSTEEAITWANSLSDPASILIAREEIAMALPAEKIDQAVKLLLDQERIVRQGFDNSSTSLLQRWISNKPNDAAQWVLRLPVGPTRQLGIEALANEWLQCDSEGALKWLSSQNSQTIRQEVNDAMAKTLAEMPDDIRKDTLQSATESTRQQIENQIDQILQLREPEPDS